MAAAKMLTAIRDKDSIKASRFVSIWGNLGEILKLCLSFGKENYFINF